MNQYLQDAEQQPQGGELTKLTQEVESHLTTLERIKKGEALLKELKSQAEHQSRVIIPDMLMEVGLKDLTMASGQKVTTQEFIEASIPTPAAIAKCKDSSDRNDLIARREEAFDWLRENSGEAIIKNALTIDLGKNSDEAKELLEGTCQKLGLPYQSGETVHAQTLKKFLKEKMEGGAVVPDEPFKIFKGSKTIVK